MTESRLPRLMVCEGYHDACFFGRLIEEHCLPRFMIKYSGGKDNFARFVRALKVEQGSHFKALTDILFVADTDDDPRSRLESVRQQIDEIFAKGAAPARALEKTSRVNGRPSISILMVPWFDERGHLESLCRPSAEGQDAHASSTVDTFMNLLHAEKWEGQSRFDKTWLRLNLTIRCARNPFVTLESVFGDPKFRGLVPLEYKYFNRVVDWLRTFEESP